MAASSLFLVTSSLSVREELNALSASALFLRKKSLALVTSASSFEDVRRLNARGSGVVPSPFSNATSFREDLGVVFAASALSGTGI